MQLPTHVYTVKNSWRGNRGTGTSSYRAYGRDFEISGGGKASVISGSSATSSRGDDSKYNPEELLLAALSACHMLWFLHLCADAGVTVTAYDDTVEGTMRVNSDGSGEFTGAVLRPSVALADPTKAHALPALHERAHELCFIARSVAFPVRCEPAACG